LSRIFGNTGGVSVATLLSIIIGGVSVALLLLIIAGVSVALFIIGGSTGATY
jgi:hypothetical protein